MPDRQFQPTDVLTTTEIGRELERVLQSLVLLEGHYRTLNRHEEADEIHAAQCRLDARIIPW